MNKKTESLIVNGGVSEPGLLCLLFSLGGYGRLQPHSSAQRRERRQESKPHFIKSEINFILLERLFIHGME